MRERATRYFLHLAQCTKLFGAECTILITFNQTNLGFPSNVLPESTLQNTIYLSIFYFAVRWGGGGELTLKFSNNFHHTLLRITFVSTHCLSSLNLVIAENWF